MKPVETILMLVTICLGAYLVLASVFGLMAIFKGRDRVYRAKYEDFLRQKERVESRLEKARQSQKE